MDGGMAKLKVLALVAYVFFGVGTECAEAGQIRMRAREHYETMQITNKLGTSSYVGFTNTINVWYEEPYRWSLGLAGSPLWAMLHAKSPLESYSSTIRLVHLGIEGKFFPLPNIVNLFFKCGVFDAQLTSNGVAGQLRGHSLLGGVGYEWDLGGIGLAPEISWRWGRLADQTEVVGSAPAIGVHFYHAL